MAGPGAPGIFWMNLNQAEDKTSGSYDDHRNCQDDDAEDSRCS